MVGALGIGCGPAGSVPPTVSISASKPAASAETSTAKPAESEITESEITTETPAAEVCGFSRFAGQEFDIEDILVPSDADQSSEDWQPGVEPRTWTSIVLHHTATRSGSVESIHASHQQQRDSRGQPWLGIGYHFVIGNGNGMPDGQAEPTFRWKQQLHGAHAGHHEYNATGIGIVLVGHFDQAPPTPAQWTSLKRLIAHLSAEYNIPADQLLGHGDIKATACPGRYLSLDDLRSGMAALNDSGGPPLARFVPATGILRKEALRR